MEKRSNKQRERGETASAYLTNAMSNERKKHGKSSNSFILLMLFFSQSSNDANDTSHETIYFIHSLFD